MSTKRQKDDKVMVMTLFPIPTLLKESFEEFLELNGYTPVNKWIDPKAEYEIMYSFEAKSHEEFQEFQEEVLDRFPKEVLGEESLKSFLDVHQN